MSEIFKRGDYQFMSYENNLPTEKWVAQQGWQCPICKAVMAPQTVMCLWCTPNSKRDKK